jgi:hypothetical protein
MEWEGDCQPDQFPKFENWGTEAQEEAREGYEIALRRLMEQGIPLELADVVISRVVQYRTEIVGQIAVLGARHFSDAAEEIVNIREQQRFSRDVADKAAKVLQEEFLGTMRQVGQALEKKIEPGIDQDIWGEGGADTSDHPR